MTLLSSFFYWAFLEKGKKSFLPPLPVQAANLGVEHELETEALRTEEHFPRALLVRCPGTFFTDSDPDSLCPLALRSPGQVTVWTEELPSWHHKAPQAFQVLPSAT